MSLLSNKSRPISNGIVSSKDQSFGESSWNEDIYDRGNLKRKKLIKKAVALINNSVDLSTVFDRYGVSFEVSHSYSGWTHTCACPFKDHNDQDPSFGYNPKENRFYCFGCDRSGGAVHFVAQMEGISIEKAAKLLLKGDISVDSNFSLFYIDYDKVEEIIFEFADYVREFRNASHEDVEKYIESVTYPLEVYLEKYSPASKISVEGLEMIVDSLKEQFELFGEE